MHRYIVIAGLLLMQKAYALSEDDSCSAKDRMPRNFVCFDNAVVDCRKPQGRTGYLVCADLKVKELEREMSVAYAKTLGSLDRPPEEGMDFVAARQALVESQKAWTRYASADCALGEALFGPGNGGAPVAMDCQVSHLKSRIRQLRALTQGGQ